MHHIGRDLKYALRGLLRSPMFTVVALLSIALGIGANTAIFTLVDEVLLRLLPVKEPGTARAVQRRAQSLRQQLGRQHVVVSDVRGLPRQLRRLAAARRRLPRVSQPVANPAPTPKVFSGMFARRPIAMNVGVDGQTERVSGELVSGTYFQVLGVGAAIGRVIVPDDDGGAATASSQCSATTTGATASAPTRTSSGSA